MNFSITIKLTITSTDRTTAKQLLVNTLMEHLPIGAAPDIDDIIIEEEGK